jgi:hypothetical protein
MRLLTLAVFFALALANAACLPWIGEGEALRGRVPPTQPHARSFIADRTNLLYSYGAQQICFSYGEATYNPATGRSGGGWQCTPAREYATRIVEARNGDDLGLEARHAAPFWLSRERTTLDDLRKRMILSGS